RVTKPMMKIRLLALLASAAALGTSAMAADGVLERAKQRGTLVAGVAWTPPVYTAGAKFRTPESVAGALAAEVAQALQADLRTLAAPASRYAGMLENGETDLVLATLSGREAPRQP